MSNYIYLTDNNNTVYRRIMDGSGTTIEMFRSFYRQDLPVQAIAVANDATHSTISSEDSDDLGQGVVYLLQQTTTTGVLTAWTMTGSFLMAWTFAASNSIKTLCIWPGNASLLLASDGTAMYFLTITTNGALETATAIPNLGFNIGQGMAVANSPVDNSAEFYVVDANVPPAIHLVQVDHVSRLVTNQQPEPIVVHNHPNLLGIASAYLGTNNYAGVNYTLYSADNEVAGVVFHELLGGYPVHPTGRMTKIRLIPFLENLVPTNLCGMVTATTNLVLAATPAAITVTTLQYLSATASVPLTGLFFGNLQPATTSSAQVVALQVANVQQISNIQLGILAANISNNPVASVFLVKSRADFNPNDVPVAGFPGINQSGLPTDSNNVAIPNATPTTSAFVNLAVACPARLIGQASAAYRWFFNFEV